MGSRFLIFIFMLAMAYLIVMLALAATGHA